MGRERAVGECRVCHGWGPVGADGRCPPCKAWARTNSIIGQCNRCGFTETVNPHHVCRLCYLVNNVDTRRDRQPFPPAQLILILPGVGRPERHAFRHPRPPWVWSSTTRPVDDESICPPLEPGQLMLLRPPRRFSHSLGERIDGRWVPGFEIVAAEVKRRAREFGHDTIRRQGTRRIANLLLAAARADGLERVPRSWIRTAPRGTDAYAVLAPFGLVDAGPERFVNAVPRSCPDCLSWGNEPVCAPCRSWRLKHQAGRCAWCRREPITIAERSGISLCRMCAVARQHRTDNGDDPTPLQLTLGGVLGPRFSSKAEVNRRAMSAAPVRAPSEHLVRADQLHLFDCERDWSRLPADENLPALTDQSQALIEAMRVFARERQWDPATTTFSVRTLTVLLSWIGAEMPIRAADIRALRRTLDKGTGNRTLAFLAAHDLLVPDPTTTASERWVTTHVDQYPDHIATEVHAWVRAMRGLGRRRRKPRSWKLIQNHLYAVRPLLNTWSTQYRSLRDVTEDHIVNGVRQVTGSAARHRLAGLRSIFGILKSERILPSDPTRTVTNSHARPLPTPLRDDQLRGLIERAEDPRAQLIVALVAVHALNVEEIRALRTDSLDNRAGTLTVVRPRGRTRILYLDELTRALIVRWLRHRHAMWPASPNPHLLFSSHGAHAADTPPLAVLTITNTFRRLGLQSRRVRSDRILHEATTTEDPVLLVRLFGITVPTAMRYLHAAHPHRTTPTR